MRRPSSKNAESGGLRVESQKKIPVYYGKTRVGAYVPDVIIDRQILIELKRKPFLTASDHRQLWHCLRGSPYRLGFLINFGDCRFEIRRVVYDTARLKRP